MNRARPAEKSIFDFFISYKHRDSQDFVTALAAELGARKYDVWVDSQEMHPGDSILKSIENGVTSSIDAIVVLSANYFSSWSEHERRAIFSLMVSEKLRIVPLWYQITYADIERMAPMFADIKGIPVADAGRPAIEATCDIIAKSYHSGQRRHRLYEMFFRCVARNFPEDQEVRTFLAIYDNDLEALKTALDKGADPNITDAALWNRYNKTALQACFPEWRKLYLYLVETGAIGAE